MTTFVSHDTMKTRYWHRLDDGRIQCDVCPRLCKLHDGERGLCFVRQNLDNRIVMTSYGRSSGFTIDPIEDKSLNHFLPGTSVLSFGTSGCNLACNFCQNWDISNSQEMDTLMVKASPDAIAQTALVLGCNSVAYTHNDPVVFHEYAIDTAQACRSLGIKSVAVSAGYVCEQPRAEFYQWMDAANIELKAFTEHFYHQNTGGHLQPVLDTLKYIKHETSVWLELKTLIIPGENDSDAELEAMTQWVVEHLGPNVPLHFSAINPDWKMQNKTRTRQLSLWKARQIALKNGVHYAYVGNVHDKTADSTYCHSCGNLLIGRDWYELSKWSLANNGSCKFCGTVCAGVFNDTPGNWGAKRSAIAMNF